jgi:hypothetical protein
MENINIDQNSINILIQELFNEKIHDLIDIKFISNLFDIIKENKPIPIKYYTKNLIELSKTTDKKCDINICKRKAFYIDEQNKYYCWIHCQSNS